MQQHGTLNPRPRDVIEPLFRENEFFDARDLVQVKYEMLRRVRVDGTSVSQSTTLFGFSRPSYYQAQMAFQEGGLVGLISGKRGHKGAHKLNTEVLDFVDQAQATQPAPRLTELARLIEEHCGFHVHQRSIQRAIAPKKTDAEEASPALIRIGKEDLVSSLGGFAPASVGTRRAVSRTGTGGAPAGRNGSWIELWSKCVPPPKSVREGSTGTSAHSVPPELRGEIASILAGLALSYQRTEANT
jgi:hypothetical protein